MDKKIKFPYRPIKQYRKRLQYVSFFNMTNISQKNQIDNFETAFNGMIGSCYRECECGKFYFDNSEFSEQEWDWEKGELENLRIDKNAIGLDYPITIVVFENHEYVIDCDCWKKRAKQIIGFIESHEHQIRKYFKNADAIKKMQRMAKGN